ncbi:PAS domain-containing protein [Seohaeicola nanhaiensis]|uniref:PAS domain-containing protein n=1 Tax=Seohaeicola nanhaiensis TaxID=1387282 RepID=A0ABV9KQN4_9RHOB
MITNHGNPAGPDAEKVVTFKRFRGGPGLSPIRQAEAYWSALRDGPGIPRRSQIDPRGLENLLEYAFILEYVAPGIARFRLAGQHLSLLCGMEVRGMPVSALFAPISRANVAAALEHVFETPAVAELSLTSEPRYGRRPISAQMILLPLKNDLGDINRALGVVVSDCDDDGALNRFDVTSTQFRPVSGLRYEADPAAEPLRPVPSGAFPPPQGPVSLPGLAEPKTRLRGRAPHLRLVTTE